MASMSEQWDEMLRTWANDPTGNLAREFMDRLVVSGEPTVPPPPPMTAEERTRFELGCPELRRQQHRGDHSTQ
jgi:hypothetical protein